MRFFLSLFVTGLLITVGCTTDSSPAAQTAPVSGKVTLDGKPIPGGEVRFSVQGEPAQILSIQDGAFAGMAYIGLNQINVVWDKEGPANPMNPAQKMKVNVVNSKFAKPDSPLNQNIPADGATDLKFAVTSAK